jgi:cysteine synthase
VALAYAGRFLEVPVELHAYVTIAPAKRARIEECGARLVLHSPDTSVTQLLEGVRTKVLGGGYWHLGQYDRTFTPGAYRDLSAELIGQLNAAAAVPRVLVCPVGTGGMIQSLGSGLRRAFPGIRVVALEPAPGSSIEGIRNTDCVHLGADDPYDRTFPDEVVRVPAPENAVVLDDLRLGASASAAWTLAQSRGWRDAVIVAPD